MNVAIIPARGGSKRLPRKNIRDFNGIPIIAHSINCAIQSGLFGRIIVSTDDEEIASIAKKYGAEVPFRRPVELSDDHATTLDVVIHAIDWLYAQGDRPSAICCLYATAPFIQPANLKLGLETLEAGNWHYVFPATTFAFPIFRSFRKTPEGLEMFHPEHLATRSQDLPEAIHDAGQFYWGRPDTWRSRIKIFDKTSSVVMVPRCYVQDIDTVEDWERAEIIWQLLKINEGKQRASHGDENCVR